MEEILEFDGWDNSSFSNNGSESNETLEISHFNCTWNETLSRFNELQCMFQGEQYSWIRIVVFLLYGLVFLVGLSGNTLVIYVVLRFNKMQTVTNMYIVNLAIADECFLVGIPFFMTTMVVQHWPFGEIMCKAYFTTTSINQITSSMFLLIMSADRFLAVCHPITSTDYRTPLIASIVAVTAWTLSALIMAPIFMYTNTLTVMDRVTCNIFWPSGWISGDQTFIIYSFLLGFLIPLFLISIFYVLVILRLKTLGPHRHHQNQNQSSASGATDGNKTLNSTTPVIPQQSRNRKKSHRKVTKLVLTVITVYFTCWAPYWILQLMLSFMEKESVHSEFLLTTFLLTGCLSYSNSAMNPILYAFLSDNFKKSFLKACSCGRRKNINPRNYKDISLFPNSRRGKGNIYKATNSIGGAPSGAGLTGSSLVTIGINGSDPSRDQESNVNDPESEDEAVSVIPKIEKSNSEPVPSTSKAFFSLDLAEIGKRESFTNIQDTEL